MIRRHSSFRLRITLLVAAFVSSLNGQWQPATLAADGTPAPAAPVYTLTDLGALTDYPYSRAYGINAKGQVVGQVAKLEPTLEAHAVLWDGKTVQNIGTPKGLAYGVAHGINSNGMVVGGCEIGNYGSHGFDFMGLADDAYLWQTGQMTSLMASDAVKAAAGPDPGLPAGVDALVGRGSHSHAYSINNAGQIAGESDNHAVVWERGKAKKLDMPTQFLRSVAYAINDKGETGGALTGREGKHQACLWNDKGLLILGNIPDNDNSVARAINHNGQVVGSCGQGNSYTSLPFLWQQGKMQVLPPLDGHAYNNEALGINNHGQIVGCGTKDGVYMHAALWENGFPCDLNDLIPAGSGLVLMKAFAINDAGQIVGEARDAQTHIHAFLLTPVAPESPLK